jgi:hypothetical protein
MGGNVPLGYYVKDRKLIVDETEAATVRLILLARGLPSGKLSMGSQTLAVIGATFGGGRSGFYLLVSESGASPKKIVSAEALLDERCAD